MSETKPNMPAVGGNLRPYPSDGTEEQKRLALEEGFASYASLAAMALHEVPLLRSTQEEANRLQAFSNAQQRRIEEALSAIREEQVHQRTDIARQQSDIKSLSGRVTTLHIRVDALDSRVGVLEAKPPLSALASLPPPRPASDSSVDLGNKSSAKIAEKFIADMKNPNTPEPTLESVKAMIEPIVTSAADQAKVAEWERYSASLVALDEQRRAAELEAEKARTKAAIEAQTAERAADLSVRTQKRLARIAFVGGGVAILWAVIKEFIDLGLHHHF
jgi:hypothetical protein